MGTGSSRYRYSYRRLCLIYLTRLSALLDYRKLKVHSAGSSLSLYLPLSRVGRRRRDRHISESRHTHTIPKTKRRTYVFARVGIATISLSRSLSYSIVRYGTSTPLHLRPFFHSDDDTLVKSLRASLYSPSELRRGLGESSWNATNWPRATSDGQSLIGRTKSKHLSRARPLSPLLIHPA